jgi:hypothetical protein
VATAATGLVTASAPPNTVVNVQPGMNVQPVILVDQTGNYISPLVSPMTALGDMIAENSAPTSARVAGNTTSTKNFLTQTGTGSASALPVWGTIAAGDLPAGTTSDLSLYLAPTGATGETFTRTMGTAYFSSLTSQQTYVSAIPLPSGLLISNLTLQLGNLAFTSVTHGWYALLDSGRVVRAVSADVTSGSWGSVNTPVTLPVSGSAYTTTYGGPYYVAVCINHSGSGEFVAAGASIGGIATTAPILSGTSGTANQTTPPSTGTTMGAITNVPTGRFYAYTS